MKKEILISLLLLIAVGLYTQPVLAQEGDADQPVYIVEQGDTLWSISLRFGVPINDLMKANGISDASNIGVGAELVIPGLEGISGLLTTNIAALGESPRSISLDKEISESQLARINRLTSPVELFAGSNVIVPVVESEDELLPGYRATLEVGMSTIEAAIIEGINPWKIRLIGDDHSPEMVVPGEIFYLEDSDGKSSGSLEPPLEAIEIADLPAVQGETIALSLQGTNIEEVTGNFGETPLNFYPDDGMFYGLQGVHAMAEPGLYPVEIHGTSDKGVPFGFFQYIYVASGGYPYDPVLVVDSETIDPEYTEPEDKQWFSYLEDGNVEKLWDGIFVSPVPAELSTCYPSRFGSRRSYNGSAYNYFHTGLDFCGATGVELYATADGFVVFSGELTVRGNATIIDHGWGVYSAYAHQSEMFVSEGDTVAAGQLIGRVGATGRVTGPHLHFEVIVGGVQVNPLDWLQQEYP